VPPIGGRPERGGLRRERTRRLVFAAERAVRPDEVRIAEAACRRRAIALVTGPQIAAAEPAEDGRPAGVGALSLQRMEDLLDRDKGLRNARDTAEPLME
jgi:hypothetical protein